MRAVIAESFERIHRSNLVGMGVLPIVFKNGQNAESLRPSGDESISIGGLDEKSLTPRQNLTVIAEARGHGELHVRSSILPPRHCGGDQLLQERRHPPDCSEEDAELVGLPSAQHKIPTKPAVDRLSSVRITEERTRMTGLIWLFLAAASAAPPWRRPRPSRRFRQGPPRASW